MEPTDETAGGDGLAIHRGFGSPVAERVHDLLAPVVATLDAELVDVEWAGGTLRVLVDRPGGITTDGLVTINRTVSPILDQHDPIPGRYTLEVSSPGVERPLRRPDHFRRAVGETVIVKAIPGVDPRRVKGVLREYGGGRLTIDVDEVDGIELAEGETHSLDLSEVASAKTHFEWGPSPKPGKTNGTGKGKRKKKRKPADQAPNETTTEEERGHEQP